MFNEKWIKFDQNIYEKYVNISLSSNVVGLLLQDKNFIRKDRLLCTFITYDKFIYSSLSCIYDIGSI